MRHKIDHPQYHLPTFKTVVQRERKAATETKQEWRGGAKVQKK